MKFRSNSTNSSSTAHQGDDEVDGVTVKWLQYAGLQHLASPVASLDQRQLLHDLLLQRYGGQAIPRSENYEYSTAQCEPLNSSGKSSKHGSKWVGIGLLDLRSTHDDTNFLSEDLTTEPLDLLPSSPPKVVNHDVSSIVSGKSQVKSNKTIRAAIDQKKSEKNAKGKEVHKSKEKATDIALALDKEIGIYNKDEDMIVTEDVEVAALQFGSPVWSPTRGLYSEISLIEGAECKRSTGKHDDDFAFIRDEETLRNPENNANNQRSFCKMENNSKKSTLSMDNITLDNATRESPMTGLDFKFNSLLEDMNKLHSFRTDRASKENNADKTTDKEIETKELDLQQLSFCHGSDSNAINSDIEEKSKRISSKSRPLSVTRGEINSKGINPTKNRIVEIKSEPHDSTYMSSPRRSESRIMASSVRQKETNSNKIRVAGDENKSIRTKKESVLSSKSQERNSKRASTQRTEINTKDNKITNIEPDKRANEQIHNPNPIPREEASSTSGTDAKSKEKNAAKFRVVVRKRPLNKKEMLKKEKDILSVEDNERLVINAPKVKVDLTAYIDKHEFSFDAVLHDHVTNDEVYNVTVGPLIPTILEQAKLTCFAFGYTGSGKTFTMGNLSLRASKDVLQMLHKTPHANRNLTLWVSYFEIHGKTIFDLLNQRRKLCIREDRDQQVRIVGLQEYETSDIDTVEKVINKGNTARSKGSTGVNEESSRSHSILQLAIKQNSMFPTNGTRKKSTESGELKAKAKGSKVIGKISFIDLAGSERGADYTHNDDIRKGVEINKSLLALKECIRALDNEQNHIPFRGSKLTEVLRDSFIGDSRTVMVCCVSPSASSCEQTLNSLRYAERVKNLCKDDYSQKDQGASENLTDPNKLDFEKITRIEGYKNSKLYNPTPEIADNLSMRDIYNFTSTIGESSFRFMSGCDFTGSKDLETHVEYKIQNDISNSYSTDYVSNLDFGTQKLPQIHGKEEQIVQCTDQAGLNIEKDIQAILENESNHSFTFSRGKEHSNDIEIVEKIPSFYESSDSHEQQKFSMMHAGPSNSLDVHQEEQVDTEPMIDEIYEKESDSDLVSTSLPLQSNEETSWNHQNQEGVPSETGDIKTVFEVENSSISDIDKEEKSVKEIGEYKNVVDVSLMARAKSTERELLLPLHMESKDLQVILSNNSTKPRLDVSTQNSLKNSENKKSPNRRIPREERNNKNTKNLSREELESPSIIHEEQHISGAKASEGLAIEKKAINLLEEEEALLAAHRKVIQNTMNILCEEMNLLEQVDQQGSVPSRYLAKLSSVLSHKAADLARLQEHVMRFQQCLQE